MRVTSRIDGAHVPTRPRSQTKFAGSTDEPDSACGVFGGDPRLTALVRKVAGAKGVDGCEAFTGGIEGTPTSRNERQSSANPPCARVGSSLLEVRKNLFGSETCNAAEPCALHSSEDRTRESLGFKPSDSWPSAARLAMTTAISSRVSSAMDPHARPKQADGADRFRAVSDNGSIRSATQVGFESGTALRTNERVGEFVDGSNEPNTNDRLVERHIGDASGLDRNVGTEAEPMSGGNGVLAWEQGRSAAIEERPTAADKREVVYRPASMEVVRHLRSGPPSTDRLTMVLHSAENGDVGVQIAIRGDDARIAIIASADLARSIERDQSVLEGHIQSSTGLSTVVSVTVGDGSFGGEDGNNRLSHAASASEDGAAERDRAPSQSGPAAEDQGQHSDLPSKTATASGVAVHGARIL